MDKIHVAHVKSSPTSEYVCVKNVTTIGFKIYQTRVLYIYYLIKNLYSMQFDFYGNKYILKKTVTYT